MIISKPLYILELSNTFSLVFIFGGSNIVKISLFNIKFILVAHQAA